MRNLLRAMAHKATGARWRAPCYFQARIPMKTGLLHLTRTCVLALATALLCAQARAGISFTLGNNPQPDEDNILLSSGGTGPSVTGTTQSDGLSVLFASTTDTLSEPASGQARIEALDDFVNNVTVALPGGSFVDLIINPFDGSGTAHVSVVANEPGGGTQTATFDYTLGNGQNFLTIVAFAGETIDSVTIDSANGFTDLRQPRISGAALNNAAPDGGSTLALLGTAIGALSVARRRAQEA